MIAKPPSLPGRIPPDSPGDVPDATEHSPWPMATVAGAGHTVLSINPAFCRLIEKPAAEIVGRPFAEAISGNAEWLTILDRVLRTGHAESHTGDPGSAVRQPFHSATTWPVVTDDRPVGVVIQVTDSAVITAPLVAINEALVLGALRQHELTETAEKLNAQLLAEIAERKAAEAALRGSEERYRDLFNSIDEGFCVAEIIFDAGGNAVDLLYLEVNPAFEKQSGLHHVQGHRLNELIPDHEKPWLDIYGQVALTGRPIRFIKETKELGRWVDIYAFRMSGPGSRRIAVVFNDITYRKRAELNLSFLATLGDDLAHLTGIDEMIDRVGARIAAHFGLSLCAFVAIDEAAEEVVISHDWHRADVPGLVGTYRLADFVEGEFIRAARTGEMIVVRDTAADPRTGPEKFAALKIASFICAPLIRDGQWRFALCLYRSAPSDWREDEIELARELTTRIWTRLERLRSEAALRESEQRYRTLFNSMDEGFCIIEVIFDEQENPIDYSYVDMNPAFERLTGLHDAKDKRVRELVPDLEQHWFNTYGKVALTGEPVRFINEAKPMQRWFDVYSFRLGGPGSRKIAVLFTNITERKTAEAALRESEERYRTLFTSIDEGFCLIDLIFDAHDRPIDYRFLEVNPTFGKQTGLLEPVGKRMRELVPALESYWFELYGAVALTGESRRFVHQAKPMGGRWFDVYACRVGGPHSRKVAIIFNDISQRVRAEEQLRQNRDTFFNLVENAPFGLYVVDEQFHLRQVSAESRKVFGHIHPLIGRDFAEILHILWPEPFASELVRLFRHTLETGEPYAAPAFTEQRHDTAKVESYDWKLERMTLPDGQFGVVCYFYDMTERRRAEELLRESEQRYRNLFETIDEGFCTAEVLFDAAGRPYDHRILEANPAFEKHTGFKDPVGKTAHELVPGLEQEWNELYGRVVTTGESLRLEKSSPAQNRWFDVFVSRAGDPAAHKVAIVFTDISARMLIQKTLAEKARLLDLTNDAIIVRDLDDKISSWNKGAERLFGWTAQEVTGQDLHHLLQTEFPKPRHEIVAQLYRERDFTGEVVQIARNGRRVPSLCRWVLDLSTKSILTSYTDITARKIAEIEMARVRDQALAASKAKDDFLAALSHELRTPLSPVLLIAGEAAGNHRLSHEVRHDFALIEKNILLEARLIDDLLDLTRITNGKVALDQRLVNLHRVVQDAIDTVRPEIYKKRLGLEVKLHAENHTVFADPVRLQQIFWNILRNAAKFTPDQGKITIESVEVATGRIAVRLTDTGLGMSSGELTDIFEAFVQGEHAGESGSHRFGGLGLGLAISRMLVGLHEGTIRAESPGKNAGSTFIVELPLAIGPEFASALASVPARKPADTVQTATPWGRTRILLVEDHESTRIVLARLLLNRGYDVTAAASLAEARSAAEVKTFDLLVSDIGLPDGEGHELMQEMRDRFGLKGIALTGYGMESDVARAAASGFVTHLIKPVTTQALTIALATALDLTPPPA